MEDIHRSRPWRISLFEHDEKALETKNSPQRQRRGEMQEHKATDAGQRNDSYSTDLHSPDERLKLVVRLRELSLDGIRAFVTFLS
jgi:hypothetical protein